MGPQDLKDVARVKARDLSGLVGELAALKGAATHWLTDPQYAALTRLGGYARGNRGGPGGGPQVGEVELEARRVSAPSR